ncbi:cysteine hydrolase family protein [Corticicoccus populi]|uniref:Cysteine hydrolase family protein n=1 Tax=Corticicoccus populi TaxID=1812821 RepID=A0ABW5WS83_9STAP
MTRVKEALIIVDMSNDFVADEGTLTVGKPAQEIVGYIRNLADTFLNKGNIVVIAMDAHIKDDKHFNTWPPHNIIGTKGQELYGELYEWHKNNLDNNKVLYQPKQNYNAFFNTDLAEKLRNENVDTVHIAGVTTDICDFLTVAGADAEGFNTVIHRRGAATFTNNGDLMIEHMERCFQTQVIE